MHRIEHAEHPEKHTHTTPQIENSTRPEQNNQKKLRQPERKDEPAHNYKMDHAKTIDQMGNKITNPEAKQRFEDARDNAGIGPNRVRMIPKGAQFYKTGDNSSGNYLTEDYPGKNKLQRKENTQAPPGNDGKLSKVESTRPQLGIESRIKPQPEWAAQAGYKPKEGLKQIYTPNNNPKGAFADGRYKTVDDKK